MSHRSHPEGLTAAEFFARGLPGFTKSAAQLATKLAYSTIHDATKSDVVPRVDTIQALQRWSESAIPEHGCFISAAKTLGLHEPGEHVTPTGTGH